MVGRASMALMFAAALGAVPASTVMAKTQPAKVSAAHPDLTGVWMIPFKIHDSGLPMGAGSTPWAPASAGDPRARRIPTLDEISAQVDARVKAQHGNPLDMSPPAQPPLTDAGLAAAAKFDSKIAEEHELACYPDNVLQRLAGGFGALLIAQNPRLIMMGTEINGDNFPRVVYLDGRSEKDVFASWQGHSTGHWAGNVLHVETVRINAGFFNQNWPISEDARLVEEYRIVNGGKRLEILQTVVDPANYREPLSRVSYLDWRPDLEIHNFPCEEGKSDQVEVNTKPSQ
jgi:hypothetical protein